MKTKVCCKCDKRKPITSFYKRKDRKIGIMYCCKLCQDNKTKSWASRNPKKYKDKNKNGHLKHYHGFSLEDFKELSKKQKHRCAICKKKTKLFVDHKHKSKPRKIRGLLCPNCNFAIGQFKDSVVSLKNAIKYIQENA